MSRSAATIEVLGVLVVTALTLERLGFETVWAGVLATPVRERGVDVRALTRRVERWGRRIPGARLCLPQAIAVATILRRHGVRGELVFGVRHHPFAAHAWVEVDGRIVLGADEAAAYDEIWRRSWSG